LLLTTYENLRSISWHVRETKTKAFNRLRRAKLGYGGLVSGSSQFPPMSQLLQKITPASKVVKSDFKTIVSLRYIKYVTHSVHKLSEFKLDTL